MIRVFPSQTKATPTDQNVYFGGPPLWRLPETEVHVSCTFTWDKPRAEQLAEQWERQGYSVQLGGPAYNDQGGDFVPGRYIKDGYAITSRGCNNKCWFCNTWKREGDIRELPIVDGWNLLDSNLLQCSETHIRSVFDMLKRQPEKAEFTGGLEAANLKDWHVDLLTELKPKRFYFAYDTPDDFGPLFVAARKIQDAGFKYWHASCYVLIGHPNDTFTKANDRLESVCKLGLFPMAMLYRDYKGQYDKQWRQFQREWVRPQIVGHKIKQLRG